MTVELLRADDNGVSVLTLNVPAKKNALTGSLRVALHDQLRELMADDAVHAIVLAGSDGAFCSGGDIALMGDGDAEDRRRRLAILHSVVKLLVAGAKPVVTAVSGIAYGGGFSLAMAADYVVADETARFCASFGRIGLTADMGLAFTLPRRIGTARTRQLVMDCRVIDAAQARAMGIVDEIVEQDRLAQTALEVARRASATPTGSLAELKALTADGLDGFLEAEMEAQMRLFESKDHVKAREAFLNKGKKPVAAGP